MKLNTDQIAEKLGISVCQTYTLIKRGALIVTRGVGPRSKFWADSKDVNALKVAGLPKGMLRSRPGAMLPKYLRPVAGGSGEGAGTGLMRRLDTIDAKLDILLAVWK